MFLSVSFDAISLILVSLAQTWQQALVAFGIFALGSGDNPTYKSVFVATVPDQHASTSSGFCMCVRIGSEGVENGGRGASSAAGIPRSLNVKDAWWLTW